MKLATALQLVDFVVAMYRLAGTAPSTPHAPPAAAAASNVLDAWRAGRRIAAGRWQPSPGKPGFYRMQDGDTVRELEASLRPTDDGQGLVLALRIWSQTGDGPITTDTLEMQPVTEESAQAAIARLAPRVRRQFGLPDDAPLFLDTRKAGPLPPAAEAEEEED